MVRFHCHSLKVVFFDRTERPLANSVAIAATRSNGINGIPLETIYCALSAQPVNLVKPLRRKIMLNSTHPNITKYSGFILSPFGSVAHLLRQRQLSLRPIDAAAAKDCGKLMYAALVPWPAALSRRLFGAAIAGNFSES